MTKLNNAKSKWIWLSVLILVVCVAATTITFVRRLDDFLFNDKGAISLISEDTITTGNSVGNVSDTQSSLNTDVQIPTNKQDNTNGSDAMDNHMSTPQAVSPQKNPNFEVSDDNVVWNTDTKVEIFRVSYSNGEQVITVNSDDSDKLIAPGTENSYTFKLKNTGNVALDYTVEVDAYFSPADIKIPISGRMNRYDNKWVVGNKDEYAAVSVLDIAKDSATLGAGKYTYYTLDWLWPFESGNDELDTTLGNLAVEQDLVFTIVIKTIASESSNPYDDSGITIPQTGDNSNPAILIVLTISSFAIMIFLLVYRKKESGRNNAEANEN